MTASLRPTRPARILLVEDNEGDILLTKKALAKSPVPHLLDVVDTGEDAISLLQRGPGFESADRPDIILLDINLPTIDGQEVLDRIKSHSSLYTIPVVMLTSSESDADVMNSYKNKANGYLVKPFDPDHFYKLARTLKDFWFVFGRVPPQS